MTDAPFAEAELPDEQETLAETAYGFRKRLNFVTQWVAAAQASCVLDMGCGSGLFLTVPLAERFPDIHFVGVDIDDATIRSAQSNNTQPNVEYLLLDKLDVARHFDVVVASEVLEHVEDPLQLMLDMRRRLVPGGTLVLTIPNGYGPFETATFFEVLLRLAGGYELLRKVKRRLTGTRPAMRDDLRDSLAVSPHLNFFSLPMIRRLAAATGFTQAGFRPRTFICGFLLTNALQGERWTGWNASVADRLPPFMVSGWMFAFRSSADPTSWRWRRGRLSRLRRSLNERRWKTSELNVRS